MNTTLTVRTDETLLKALRERARALGKSVSEVVRETLEQALVERPLGAKSGHLEGQLDLSQTRQDPWREELRERNWRA